MQDLSTGLGVVLVLVGLVLGLVEAGRVEERNKLASALDVWWRDLAASSWRAVPVDSAMRLMSRVRGIVRANFSQADRGPAFGIVFLGMTFVLIPLAAVLNLLIGGSPFLALYYLSNLIALAMLNFTGESRRLALINRIAAFYLGLSVFLVIPAYVLQSFTDRMLHSPITHAVLESLLVAPLLFIVAQSLMLGWGSYVRGAGPTLGRFVRIFLAALPVAYILTFVAWQFGSAIEEGEARMPGTWPLLASSVLFSALALPVTDLVVEWTTRSRALGRLFLGGSAAIIAAGGLAVALHQAAALPARSQPAIGESIGLLLGQGPTGPGSGIEASLWAIYLPILPLAYFVGGIVVAMFGKAFAGPFARFMGDGVVVTKPILATGVLCVTIGIVVWVGGQFS